MRERQKSKLRPKVGQVVQIPTEAIYPNPRQPRKEFAYDKLIELAQSICENGLIQPLTVTVSEEGTVTLVAGERRLRAAKMVGLATVPCFVTEVTDEQSAVLALVENLQRQDLNCFEQAESMDKLIRFYGLTQEEAAQRLGYTQSAVANKLRLLALSEEEREALLRAGATERHARALLKLSREQRLTMIARLEKERWTVAQTEREAEKLLAPSARRKILPLVRDVRLFFNTVEHAVETMRRSGIYSETERNETEGYYEYIIRIPKTENEPKKLRRV